MKHIIELFGLVIVANGRYLLIKSNRDARFHLRVDPEPQKKGRRWFFTPHVTDERTGEKPIFPRIPVEAIEPIMRGIVGDLRDLWLAAHRPVNLEELDETGWFTIRYDDEHFERCVASASDGAGRWRIDDEFFRRFAFPDDVEDRVALPSMLRDDPVPLRSPFTIMREGADRGVRVGFPGSLPRLGRLVPGPDRLPQARGSGDGLREARAPRVLDDPGEHLGGHGSRKPEQDRCVDRTGSRVGTARRGTLARAAC